MKNFAELLPRYIDLDLPRVVPYPPLSDYSEKVGEVLYDMPTFRDNFIYLGVGNIFEADEVGGKYSHICAAILNRAQLAHRREPTINPATGLSGYMLLLGSDRPNLMLVSERYSAGASNGFNLKGAGRLVFYFCRRDSLAHETISNFKPERISRYEYLVHQTEPQIVVNEEF